MVSKLPETPDEVDEFLLDAEVHVVFNCGNDFEDVYDIIESCRKLNGGNWRNIWGLRSTDRTGIF